MLIESVLKETYKATNKIHGIDPRSHAGFRATLSDPNAFKTYVKGLMEGLSYEDKISFATLAKNTRKQLMESNSMMQIPAYETFVLPILRVFFPKLIAKELVNVMPIDKPIVIQGFIKPKFALANSSNFNYSFPSVSQDISAMAGPGVTSSAYASSGGNTSILASLGLTSAQAHVEKNFAITGVVDSTGAVTAVTILPDVDGNFGAAVTTASHGTDYVSGHIDYLNGILYWSSQEGVVSKLRYQSYIALEENAINPQAEFDMVKISLVATDRRISAKWTLNLEQDAKALWDVQLQSEMVNFIGEQIAIDIDREIITDIINTNAAQNAASHSVTFSKTPSGGFAFGPKQWYENVLLPLNTVSAQIYNDSLMGAANTIACNPLDAVVFEALNTFEYLGDATAGGDLGYRSATVGSGKWKVLVSNLVPSGSVIVKHRSDELSKASYIYSPYVPALLSPYPLGNNPSMTVMSRYAKKVIRPEALGVLNITT